MRLIQHKKEAYWFYRYLSIFYDKLVNPLFWTRWMRDQGLELAKLEENDISVIDVGSGTGFTTQGIIKFVNTSSVTCMDQSPHQMAKAKQKKELEGCTFLIGDAENIPVDTDSFDRYVSAGSIEYWPNPQRGINESYRVIKPGGIALMIGPLQPKSWFARLMADTWMLFPSDEEYKKWYHHAGFENIEYKYLKPHWYPDDKGYAIAISGQKMRPGHSPNPAPILEKESGGNQMSLERRLLMMVRIIVGSAAGFVFIPIALMGYLVNSFRKQDDRPQEYIERLNGYQVAVVVLIFLILGIIVYCIIT